MSDILISFLVTYRTPDPAPGGIVHIDGSVEGCSRRDIFHLLDCMKRTFTKPEDQKRIEFVIKLDEDDAVAVSQIPKFTEYPFVINPVVYKQWEGRWCFNYHQMYIFSKINPSSKFVGILTDDCFFHQPKGNRLIKEIEKYKDDPYVICWGSPFKEFDVVYEIDFKERFEEVEDYRTTAEKWTTSFLTYGYPIVSRKVIECMGNMGWLMNVDVSFGLLSIILYHKYDICLIKLLQNLVIDRKDNQRAAKYEKNSFNVDTRITDIKVSPNSHFFKLAEQQAKNIYLNIKEDGLLDKYKL